MWIAGRLDMALKHGIIKSKIVAYLPIYQDYLREREVGHNYTKACEITAERMNTTVTTVKRAIAEVG
jgi:hypothetical protein